MSDPYIPAIVKDFHVLYRAALAATSEETWAAREALLAQLDRLRPLFEECEAVRRSPPPWSDALDDYALAVNHRARVLMLARKFAKHWRDQGGVNAAVLDELADAVEADERASQ